MGRTPWVNAPCGGIGREILELVQDYPGAPAYEAIYGAEYYPGICPPGPGPEVSFDPGFSGTFGTGGVFSFSGPTQADPVNYTPWSFTNLTGTDVVNGVAQRISGTVDPGAVQGGPQPVEFDRVDYDTEFLGATGDAFYVLPGTHDPNPNAILKNNPDSFAPALSVPTCGAISVSAPLQASFHVDLTFQNYQTDGTGTVVPGGQIRFGWFDGAGAHSINAPVNVTTSVPGGGTILVTAGSVAGPPEAGSISVDVTNLGELPKFQQAYFRLQNADGIYGPRRTCTY